MINIKNLKRITKNLTLLYVEDEDDLRESLQVYLSKLFANVVIAKNGQEGIDYYKEQKFDIVVSDIQMPIKNGLEMAKEIKEIDMEQEIIITSAYSETSYFLDAISIGVNGYIIKPIDYVQMNQELYKSSIKISYMKENQNYKAHLEEMVYERTEKILAMEEDKIDNFENTILSFVEMIEDRDTYTGGHSQRVAEYSKLIAQEMGCSEEDCELLYKAGIIHDIGKIATPDTILLKPARLNSIEYKLIQEHVVVGYQLLFKIPMYREHAKIIKSHHERYDGKGYPDALKGDEISLLSHILLLSDAFDAMTTNRIYKARKSIDSAIKELQEFSGKQFHPKVVLAAVEVLKDVVIPEEVTQLPKTEIEKERFSYFFRDQVTDAYNYDYLNFVIEQKIINREYGYIEKIYLHNFNSFNISQGWVKGDKLLNNFVSCLHQDYPSATIFRVHGDDFVLMTEETLDINISKLKSLSYLEENSITLSCKSIKLKDVTIDSMEELEKLI